jgi:hypothetical protein
MVNALTRLSQKLAQNIFQILKGSSVDANSIPQNLDYVREIRDAGLQVVIPVNDAADPLAVTPYPLPSLKTFFAANYTAAGSPVSKQFYTTSVGKTAYLTDIVLRDTVAGGITLRDAVADSGTIKLFSSVPTGVWNNHFTVPIPFVNGIRMDAADQTTLQATDVTLIGFEV